MIRGRERQSVPNATTVFLNVSAQRGVGRMVDNKKGKDVVARLPPRASIKDNNGDSYHGNKKYMNIRYK